VLYRSLLRCFIGLFCHTIEKQTKVSRKSHGLQVESPDLLFLFRLEFLWNHLSETIWDHYRSLLSHDRKKNEKKTKDSRRKSSSTSRIQESPDLLLLLHLKFLWNHLYQWVMSTSRIQESLDLLLLFHLEFWLSSELTFENLYLEY